MNKEISHATATRTSAQSKLKKYFLSAPVIVSITAFLLPVLIVPFGVVSIQFSKILLIVLAVAFLYSMFSLRMIRKGTVVKYWSLALVSFSVLPIVYLLTALFSESPTRSFFGYQFETDTFGFILLAVLFTNAVVLLVRRSELNDVLRGVLYGAWIVIIFQLVQVVSGLVLGGGLLGNPTVNMIGKWNDFGIFAGLLGSLSLIAFFALHLKRQAKVLFAVTYFFSIFFLALVNLTEAWILFGVVSFGMSALLFMQKGNNAEETTNLFGFFMPTIGVVLALFFVFAGSGASAMLQNTFNITALEVRPSITGTMHVLQESYKENPVLGSGPNTFSSQWLEYRNDGVLNTLFWNTAFPVGSGMIPTMFVTGGIVTALAWILFSLVLIYTVFRSIFITPVFGATYTVTVLSGIAALYLLISHYIYTPSQVLTLLFALALGIFFVSLKKTPLLHSVHISIEMPHMRRAVMVVTVIVLILATASVYGVSRTYASSIFHERAIRTANAGDLNRSESLVQTALSLRGQDRYYRTAALINITQVNQLVNTEEAAAPENAVELFQKNLSEAVQHANQAVQKDRQSFENWITLTTVYSSVIPLEIDGALENAVAALEEVRIRSPKSPEVDYRLAQIETVTTNDIQKARAHLEAALEKRQGYTQAILLLAQIELNEGNLAEAIESVRAAVFFEPNNPVLLYQLGILLLQDQDYEESARAFEAALQRQPNYSNAAFFLSQSYAFLDRLDEAAQIMTQVAERNPDSDIAQDFAEAMNRGENPFDPGQVTSPETEAVEVQ